MVVPMVVASWVVRVDAVALRDWVPAVVAREAVAAVAAAKVVAVAARGADVVAMATRVRAASQDWAAAERATGAVARAVSGEGVVRAVGWVAPLVVREVAVAQALGVDLAQSENWASSQKASCRCLPKPC